MWNPIKQILKPKKERRTNREQLDRMYNCELFDKVEKLTSMYGGNDTLIFHVGDYYWNTVPKFMKYEWKKRNDSDGLIPFKKDKIKRGNAVIIHDPTKKYRFEVE